MKGGINTKKNHIISASILVITIALLFVLRQIPNKDIEIPDEEVPLGTNADRELQLSVRDFGAVGDGITDDTESIQRAVDYAHNNNIENIVIPDGHYMVSLNRRISGRYTAISLYSNMNIYMDENTVIEALPTNQNNYAIFNIIDCDNVVIDGGTIIGERLKHIGDTGTHGMGVNVFNSRNITIKKVNIRDCWGDGIYIGGLDNTQINKNVLVSEVNISNCRRQGISITTGDGITVRDSMIHDISGAAPQSGIDIETNWNDTPVKNVIVENNTFFNNGTQDVVLGGICEDIVIVGNTFDTNTLSTNQIAINSANGNRIMIYSNKISGRSQGITCRHASNVSIYSNEIDGYIENGVYMGEAVSLVDDSSYVEIFDNKFSNLNKGISIAGNVQKVNNVSITNNTIENIQTDCFFGYSRVNNLTITKNFIRNVIERYGIMISYGENVTISDNLIEECGLYHILVANGDIININRNEMINRASSKAEHFLAVKEDVQECTISNNTFTSDDKNKKIVKVSLTANYPLRLENNRATYYTTSFNINGIHIVKSNIIDVL